jgi:hypothetical protein
MVRKEGVEKCLPQVVEQLLQSCVVTEKRREAVVSCGEKQRLGAQESAVVSSLDDSHSVDDSHLNVTQPQPPLNEATDTCGNYCADNSAATASGEQADKSCVAVKEGAAAICDEPMTHASQPVVETTGGAKSAGTIASQRRKVRKFTAIGAPFSPAETATLARLERAFGMRVTSEFATEKVNEYELRDVLRIDLNSYERGQLVGIEEWRKLLVEREKDSG